MLNDIERRIRINNGFNDIYNSLKDIRHVIDREILRIELCTNNEGYL